MESIINSNIFFFISSLGFISLWILSAILLYYLIRAARSFYRIMEGIENNINKVGDVTKEMLQDIRDSFWFRFLVRKKRKTPKE